MIKTITSYFSGESFECEIVDFDDLPRGSDLITTVLNEEDMTNYEAYRNCVDHMYYACVEE